MNSKSLAIAVAALLVQVLTACTVNPEPGKCEGFTGGSIRMMVVEFDVLENRTIDNFRAMVQVHSGNSITINYIHPAYPIEISSSGAFSFSEDSSSVFGISGTFTDPVTATVSYSVSKFEGIPVDHVREDVPVECEQP